MGDEDQESLFGRLEAAVLMAVEYANGGEWAYLEQVLAGFDSMFDRLPDSLEVTDAFGLLCEAGLIDYRGGGLELTPPGRKLLRHSGMPGGPGRPVKVLEQLQKIKDHQLAEEGSVPEPPPEKVAAALQDLRTPAGEAFVGYMGAKEEPAFTVVFPAGYGHAIPPEPGIERPTAPPRGAD